MNFAAFSRFWLVARLSFRFKLQKNRRKNVARQDISMEIGENMCIQVVTPIHTGEKMSRQTGDIIGASQSWICPFPSHCRYIPFSVHLGECRSYHIRLETIHLIAHLIMKTSNVLNCWLFVHYTLYRHNNTKLKTYLYGSSQILLILSRVQRLSLQSLSYYLDTAELMSFGVGSRRQEHCII